VSRGEALLAPTVTRSLISEFVPAAPPGDPAAGRDVLTAREQEIVELVARGLTNDEIAGRMVISPLTAKTHVNRAMMKLHCRDRAQLVVWAYESGLIAPRRR
jgi:DNA-binding NarL/FixJ family response regulator